MSDKIISISIDVTMLDKSRFVPGKKANAKGLAPQYANLDVKLLENPKFDNNYIVVERSTKEERMAKVKLPIVGKGKTIIGSGGFKKQESASRQKSESQISGEDDVPF